MLKNSGRWASVLGRLRPRHISLNATETFTKLNNRDDPQRNQFFQYSWGLWLRNGKVERARRETRFSIEGLADFVKTLEKGKTGISQLDNGTTVLSDNITSELGDTEIKLIASIHEGKRHRIYKLTLASGKSLVLRIPYKLQSDFAIEHKIKSEVATLDFLKEHVGVNVPRVLAYGPTRVNPVQAPFILMEHIEGDLLMKQWNPLAQGLEEAQLESVIQTVADFHNKVISVPLSQYGSLYFPHDLAKKYENAVDSDRWVIGPSVEKVYLKHKELGAQEVLALAGPWKNAQDMVASVAQIHIEALRRRIALAAADSGSKAEDVPQLERQVASFENLAKMGTLIAPQSPAIRSVEALFVPRLALPDLDPLNVVVNERGPHFLDFEYAAVKPFAWTAYPAFVAYHGSKVYSLEDDVPGFAEMDPVEQLQFQFMHHKTRNERLWEVALNKAHPELIAVALPHVKLLRAPYLHALEAKTDKDHLFVENALVQLQPMWETYVANGLCEGTAEFPVEYTAEYLDTHALELENYQLEVALTPFAATGGWVPQDMFDMLQSQGLLVGDSEGNYTVETEKALK